MRFYVVGQLAIEGALGVAHQYDLPGRQGRLVWAYLVIERRLVARSELTSLIWPEEAPDSADVALNAVISKLRAVLRAADPAATIESGNGGYELRLPPGTWVDYDVATEALHRAEAAGRVQDYVTVWGEAAVTYQIAKRPFIVGDDGEWIDRCRGRLRSLFAQASQILADISLANGETGLTMRLAEELIDLEPYREEAYRLLMRAQLAAGNRAESLVTFERCRRLLAEELGVDPAPETQALHLEALTA